jgi:transcriptional regulator with XRE-family HTH domain
MRTVPEEPPPTASTPYGWRRRILRAPSRPACSNRILAVLEHIPRYAFDGPARLAEDAGVARSTVWRVVCGECQPTYRVMCLLAEAVGERLGKSVDPRELVTFDGTYPTPSVCELAGCRGCLPSHFYTPDDELRPEYQNVTPGEWSSAYVDSPIETA